MPIQRPAANALFRLARRTVAASAARVGPGSSRSVKYASASSPKPRETGKARRAGERTNASTPWKLHSRSTWPTTSAHTRAAAGIWGRPRPSPGVRT